MEYYSAIKRNEIELFVVRWIDLESVIQSEVSQKEKGPTFKFKALGYLQFNQGVRVHRAENNLP